jgi:hypothetical protein
MWVVELMKYYRLELELKVVILEIKYYRLEL